jgi:rubrerythrin
MLDEAHRLDGRQGDYVEFVRAGAPAAGAYHCSECGYGVIVRVSLPQCPMCSGTTWEPAAVSAFSRTTFQ